MAISYFRMTNNEFWNKGMDVVPEQTPLFILDINSAIYMANNGGYIKHTRHIYRSMNVV